MNKYLDLVGSFNELLQEKDEVLLRNYDLSKLINSLEKVNHEAQPRCLGTFFEIDVSNSHECYKVKNKERGINMNIKQYERLLAIALDKLEQAELEIMLLKHENNRLQKRITKE